MNPPAKTQRNQHLNTEHSEKNTVVGRWKHRLIDGKVPLPAQRYDYPPHGVVANPKRVNPQPYPVENAGDFYFKTGKLFSLVYQGKIGTFEQWGKVTGVSLDNLRYRLRSGMSMDEVMSGSKLNETDHIARPEQAQRYCPCPACKARRLQRWTTELEPIQAPNAEDQGNLYRRADNSIVVDTTEGLMDFGALAKALGMKSTTLYSRVFIYQWTLERALSQPLQVRKKKKA